MEGERMVEQISWFDDRFYKVQTDNGVDYYPSVTTKLGLIIPPFLQRWRGDLGNREADYRLFEAQERGKRIHRGWDTLCRGGRVVYSNWQDPQEVGGDDYACPYQDEMVDLWKLKQLYDALNPKILSSERTVVSHKHREAGTLDTLLSVEAGSYNVSGSKPLELSGGVYVADLKTGNVVDNKAFYQTAAYAMMVQETLNLEVVGTMILHTGSKNKRGISGLNVLVRESADLQKDYETYRKIADLWDIENEGLEPKLFDFPATLKLEDK